MSERGVVVDKLKEFYTHKNEPKRLNLEVDIDKQIMDFTKQLLQNLIDITKNQKIKFDLTLELNVLKTINNLHFFSTKKLLEGIKNFIDGENYSLTFNSFTLDLSTGKINLNDVWKGKESPFSGDKVTIPNPRDFGLGKTLN